MMTKNKVKLLIWQSNGSRDNRMFVSIGPAFWQNYTGLDRQ